MFGSSKCGLRIDFRLVGFADPLTTVVFITNLLVFEGVRVISAKNKGQGKEILGFADPSEGFSSQGNGCNSRRLFCFPIYSEKSRRDKVDPLL